jgi:ubiquinone/menaquinone biosynthesis C-methylase UbiE
MPFRNKQFGACFNEHTLEHLETAEDVEKAVNECVRVADLTVLLAPTPYGLYANLLCPTHYLRMWFENGKIRVIDNRYLTGIGYHAPAIGNGIMISDNKTSSI